MQCKTNAKSVYVHRLLNMLETALNREEETSISICNELIKSSCVQPQAESRNR